MKVLFPALAGVCFVLTAGLPVWAQTERAERPERPYRGLFAPSLGDTSQRLVLNASLGSGYDTNLIADGGGDQPSVSDMNTDFRGWVTQASVQLGYQLNLSRVNFAASAGTSGRYYPQLVERVLRRDYAQLATSVQVIEGLTVSASGGYAPYDLATFFLPAMSDSAALITSPDFDFVSSREHSFLYQGSVDFSRQLSRRSSVMMRYGYGAREEASGIGEFRGQQVGGRFTYTLGRGLNLYAGYRLEEALYGEGRRARNHVIDSGIDFSHRLSFSRRTALSFGTGTTASSEPREGGAVTRYNANANVQLTHEIGRTWNASVSYGRGASFVETWPEPLFGDSLSATLSGFVTRRVQFDLTARASVGRVGFAEEDERYTASYGQARLGTAISRNLGIFTSYTYYLHEFDQATPLPPGFASSVNRHGVRIYMNVWLPVFHKARRADAAR
jgi:hypothetical protein